MKFFKHCRTLADIKSEYKRLAKLHHPDVGGDLETMQAVNAEYDNAVKLIANNPHHADTKRAQAEDSEKFRDIIAALIKIPNIVIELCGSWIWITGDTYTHRDALKAAGCKWAKNKAAWYWHAPEDFCQSRRNLSLDDIRRLHGSSLIAQTVANDPVMIPA